MLVCLYFFNVWFTAIQTWLFYGEKFPLLTIWLIGPAVMLIMDKQAKIVSVLLMLDIVKDNALLLYGVAQTWRYRHVLYVNELMVKKLSLLGAMCLILFGAFKKDITSSKSYGSLLATSKFTNIQSAALLVARLLLCALFIWAGQGEVRRQLASIHGDGHGHIVHDRRVGDGHDQIWAKLSEFAFAVPLCFGYKTKHVCCGLATLCVLEAVVQWSGLTPWGSGVFYDWAKIGPFYVIHAREHFVVNLSAAGGMILLAGFGAGKYSMDEYLKKQD